MGVVGSLISNRDYSRFNVSADASAPTSLSTQNDPEKSSSPPSFAESPESMTQSVNSKTVENAVSDNVINPGSERSLENEFQNDDKNGDGKDSSSDEKSPVAKQKEVSDFRTWTDVTGKFSTSATFVRKTNTDVVLKLQDGREITVPIAKLSPESKKMLEGL